jgi:glycosyltransferase involved in cell wall biosynthesis
VQSYRGQYETIFVDSSDDRTPEIVSEKYPEVKLIHLDHKTDPGSARNIGIGEAKGELIAFIDSDCIAANDWLEQLSFAHESSYNVVGGSVDNANGDNHLVACAGYISEFREFIPRRPAGEVSHVPSCNISYKKEIFQKYGLFRGEYYPQEDLAFNFMLSKAGEKIFFDPDIKVYHQTRTRWRDFLRHQERIGAITSQVLKVIPLPGSFIVHHPALAPFLLPLLPFVKFTKTLAAFLKFQPRAITARPLVLLLFAVGLIFWVVGFARGIYKKPLSEAGMEGK